MKNFLFFLSILSCLALFSCKKFADFQTDPNRINEAPPELIMSTIAQQVFASSINPEIGLITRQLVFTDGASEYQYYNWNRRNWQNQFDKLRQIQRLELEIQRSRQNQYLPIAIFAKSYVFYELTMLYGDIPFQNALQANSKNFMPEYTRQKDVFIEILNQLSTANSLITKDTNPVQNDWIYQGDMQKWKKLINSFTLRILISLSKKVNDNDLKVKEKFLNIVNNPQKYPLFERNEDNAGLNYLDMANNRYPYFNSNSLQTAYYMEGTFVNLLKQTEDKRLFKFAAPLNKKPENNFDSYAAIAGSLAFSEVNSAAKKGDVSGLNSRYYSQPINEMALGMSYAELELILAEAISRNWISGNAEEKYNNGVKSSFSFFKLSNSEAESYLKKHPFNPSKALEMIITQKYINSFMNNGWLGFFENRRTGFPVFDVSGSGVLNNKSVPKRFMYDSSELQFNQKNVQNAIQSQFNGSETVNGQIWIIQN